MLAPVLALCACSGASHTESSSRGVRVAPTTLPRATTTTRPTPATPYSFDDSVPPPKLVNTGTNYIAIASSLIDYEEWLLARHPDPLLIDQIAPRGFPARKALANDIPILQQTNRRLVERVSAPNTFAVVSARPDVASIQLTQHLTREEVFDSTGRLVSVHDTSTTKYLLLIARVRNRWYLASSDEQPNG